MNLKNILLLLLLSLPMGLFGLEKNEKKTIFAKKVREIIKMGGNLNFCDENNVPLLVRAMYNNDIELFREMLQTNSIIVDYKYGVSYKSIVTATVLTITCMSDSDKSEFIQLLLDYGADINQKDSPDLTPLMWTAVKSNKENLKVLLKNKNININDTKLDGFTALMAACQSTNLNDNYYELIQDLIFYGADPNMQKKACGSTALMFLVKSTELNTEKKENKLVKIARMLMFAGADPEIRDNNGKIFLDYATKKSFRTKLENMCKKYKEHLNQLLNQNHNNGNTNLKSSINTIIADYVL